MSTLSRIWLTTKKWEFKRESVISPRYVSLHYRGVYWRLDNGGNDPLEPRWSWSELEAEGQKKEVYTELWRVAESQHEGIVS